MSSDSIKVPASNKLLLTVICVGILVGILIAGLWPFHAPKNEVSWLRDGKGLFFGKHGSIVSVGSFGAARLRAGNDCSIDIWLEPSRVSSSGTILAFYWLDNRIVPFAIRQSLGDLKLEHRGQDDSAKKPRIYVNDVFSRLEPVFLTISSGESGTAIYVNGSLIKKFAKFRVSRSELSGLLIIGNAPSTADSWSGKVRSLAVYDHELAASEAAQHFSDRTKGGQPTQSEDAIASYQFDEGTGMIVHNRKAWAPNLLIPERFFVLNEQFLEPPWDEYIPGRNYWEDVGTNVIGFIPFGFFAGAYFSVIWKIKRSTWLTIALGFTVSLTIEVLQSFLPTRNSGMTDLITNTIGTALGVILCAWSMKHSWFARSGLSSPLSSKDEETCVTCLNR